MKDAMTYAAMASFICSYKRKPNNYSILLYDGRAVENASGQHLQEGFQPDLELLRIRT